MELFCATKLTVWQIPYISTLISHGAIHKEVK